MIDDGKRSTSMMQQIFYLMAQLWTTETPGREGAQFSISIKKKGAVLVSAAGRRPAGTGGRSEVTEAPLLSDYYSKKKSQHKHQQQCLAATVQDIKSVNFMMLN